MEVWVFDISSPLEAAIPVDHFDGGEVSPHDGPGNIHLSVSFVLQISKPDMIQPWWVYWITG